MERATESGLPELRGQRVRLVPLTDEHLSAIRRWRSDPEVTRYWITRHVPSKDELLAWLRENRRTGSLTWCIQDERRQPIGYTDVFNVSREHRRCEIALMIGERDRWGQGYARETLMTLLGYLFAPAPGSGFGIHKVSLAVVAENHAARRVYRRCGFREEGVLREDLLYDGAWHDQILMSVLEDEFQSGPPPDEG